MHSDRWLVEIRSLSGDLEVLDGVLKGLGYEIVSRRGSDGKRAQFLRSYVYDSIDSHQKVWEDAKRVRDRLAELSKIDDDFDATLALGSIHEELADGDRRQHHYAEGAITMRLSMEGKGVFISRGNVSDDDRRKREFEQERQKRIERQARATRRGIAAVSDDSALRVIKLLNHELTPTTLGNIVETIQSDLGGGIHDFISKKQLSRFNQSINHPNVFGPQARHGVSNESPPPKPMSLSEARQLVRELAEIWLWRKGDPRGPNVA